MPEAPEAATARAKAALRKAVLARRDAIPARERERRSRVACAELMRMLEKGLAATGKPGTGIVCATFSPLGSEVDVGTFTREAYRRGWRVAFPCMERTGGQAMTFRFVSRNAHEQGTAAFLAHPARPLAPKDIDDAAYPLCAPGEIDAIVAPLVAFDGAGMRMGYGGGNYDRLLPLLRPDACICGIAFAEQKVKAVPVAEHDLPLPHIVVA